jgi:vacuolar-type H+-ATPase subunit H
VRERIGYALAFLAVGAAVAINALASNPISYAEREARVIASATRTMATRWDSEHLDDARTALERIRSEAASCRSKRATRTVAVLTALETAGGDAINDWVKQLVDLHAGDGALRRGIRARVRDHDELVAITRYPCSPSRKDRNIVRRHRQRSIAILRAAVRLKELGVSTDTANRFADPALPVRELRNQVIAGH